MPSVTSYTAAAIDLMMASVTTITFNHLTEIDDYTLVATDVRKTILIENVDPNDFTVPPNSDVGIAIGSWVDVLVIGLGTTTFVPGAGVSINTLHGLDSAGQNAAIRLVKTGTDDWYISGDLTT